VGEKKFPSIFRALLVGLIFGLIALGVVLAELHVLIPGTDVVSDPREIFTTLGAALSGPIGGIIIGFLAGIAEPGGIPLASLLAHIAGGIWMGFAYKKLVYNRLQMPLRLLGWIGSVIIYYFVFAVAGFAIGLSLFYGDKTSIMQLYLAIAKGVVWEVCIVVIVTTLVWFALPSRYTKPLW
jgi:hypothetical protein